MNIDIVDNGDGSGATITVSDSDPAAVNSFYVSSFSGEIGSSNSWVLVDSRVGDGDIDSDIDVGYYFGILTSTTDDVTVVSRVIYFKVSNGDESVHYACLLAAQSRVKLLNLADVDADNVVVKKLPIDRIIKRKDNPLPLPCVLLTPMRQTMDPKEGVTSKDDVVYPVLCSVIAADNQEPTLEANLSRQMLWIQQIARAFRNQRLPGVASVVITSVNPMDVVAPPLWNQNVMASGLILNFRSREPRGLSA